MCCFKRPVQKRELGGPGVLRGTRTFAFCASERFDLQSVTIFHRITQFYRAARLQAFTGG